MIFYDQLGCGRSDRPVGQALWTVERFVQELAQAVPALGLTRLHLFGSSWAGMLAMQYVLSPASRTGKSDLVWQPGQHDPLGQRLYGTPVGPPAEVRQVIAEHEAAGFTACPEYQAAILGFYREHVCRLSTWPASLERSFAEACDEVTTR